MLDRLFRPWLAAPLRNSPYPEREPPQPKWWDRALTSAAIEIRPSWSRPGLLSWSIASAVIRRADALRVDSDQALAARARALRPRLLTWGFTPHLVVEGFALTREACRRQLGIAHHAVQIVGGHIILRGGLAEMATGEGKTITALLPATLAAMAGVPVHVVTVNDYLASRDAEHLRPVFALLGLTVGLVAQGQDPATRKAAYDADITYATNKDIAFDYLRDRIAVRALQSRARVGADRIVTGRGSEAALILRGLHFAIVDEADSVLIDEARTPLIISGPTESGGDDAALLRVLDVARGFVRDVDHIVEADQRRIVLTDTGRAKAAAATEGFVGTLRALRAREELVTQALTALELFHRDTHYIVREGKVQIVDESTGRIMADRQWERGLHQLIEIKEAVEMSPRRVTLGRLTYERFFSRYLWFGGMTGTAAEVGRELRRVYDLPVTRVPTHARVRRRHVATRLLPTQHQKWRSVIVAAQAMTAQGRAVLIGTRSVSASEALGAMLAEAGIAHTMLNARQDADEATIIGDAGQPGHITVATNMAGRGTDIRLDPATHRAGGLHVILTEFHESARIDRQLYGRAGRQGDPGSTEAIVALDDDIVRDHGGIVSRIIARLWQGRDDLPAVLARVLRADAQRRAEALAARARRQTIRTGRDLETALAFTYRAD